MTDAWLINSHCAGNCLTLRTDYREVCAFPFLNHSGHSFGCKRMSVDADTTDADYAFGENDCTDRRYVREEKTKHQKTNDLTEVKPVWSCVYTTSTPILRTTQSRCFVTCKKPDRCGVTRSRHAPLGPTTASAGKRSASRELVFLGESATSNVSCRSLWQRCTAGADILVLLSCVRFRFSWAYFRGFPLRYLRD